MARLAIEGVAPDGTISLEPLRRTLTNPTTWIATAHSLVTAFGGTFLAVVIGGGVAVIVSLTDIRGRDAFVFCFVMPLLLAPQVVALAWLQLFSPSSPLLKLAGAAPLLGARNPLYSAAGIILVLGVQYAPLSYLMLRAALRALPRELIEAGRSPAVRRQLTVLRTIVLPLMTPPAARGDRAVLRLVSREFRHSGAARHPGQLCRAADADLPAARGIRPHGAARRGRAVAVDRDDRRARHRRAGHAAARARLPHQHGYHHRTRVRTAALAPARRNRAVVAARRRARPAADRARADGRSFPRSALRSTRTRRRSRTSASCCSSTRLRGARSSTASRLSAAAAVDDRADRRFRSRTSSSGAARGCCAWSTSSPRSRTRVPGVVLAIAAILLFLKPLPLIGISIYNTVWIILFCYLARFLVLGLRPVVSGYHQLDRTLEEAVADRRRAPRRGGCARSSCRWSRPTAAAGALLIFLTAFNELTRVGAAVVVGIRDARRRRSSRSSRAATRLTPRRSACSRWPSASR